MHRFILALSVLGILILTSCAGNALEVRNSNDRIVGTISVQGVKSATILNTHGDVRGRVRGNIIRDDTGKNMGTVAERDGNMVILNPEGNALGSVKNGECYGKGQESLGSVSGEAETEVVAAACLLFFLQ
ncbi:MAG: hypothetical protein HOO67_07965 [Candidatus Peribacteraceae bacterium]|nr:hypothetical protein [Candidatus Peribacteraceae bacterium]